MPRMSPIPKTNEPANNPESSGTGQDGDGLEPPSEDYLPSLNAVSFLRYLKNRRKDFHQLNSRDVSSDDDSDDGDETQYGGYQLLAQDPEHLDDDDDDDDEEDEAQVEDAKVDEAENVGKGINQDTASSVSAGSSSSLQPNLPPHLARLLPSASPGPDAATQVMHTDTESTLEQRKNLMATDDQIRAAMTGFSLPPTAIPHWAMSVEEEDWKQQLVARIQSKREKQQRIGAVQKGKGDQR